MPTGCFSPLEQEIVCHADGSTFTVTVEGFNSCTGATTTLTFTASGGAVGEEMCVSLIVDDGGFCCVTELCLVVPDCSAALGDVDGDGVVGTSDALALLSAWGACDACDGCPTDLDGDCEVGVTDLLALLGNWT
jgi:hypothetical protein